MMAKSASIKTIPRLSLVLDEQLLEALPAAVYVVDRDGVVVRYNKRAAELWGRSPIPGDANELYCGSHRLYLPSGDLLPHNQTPMVEAMRSGTSFRNLEVQIEQPSGKRIWVMVSIDPLRDESGEIVGAINCFQDVTDHKLAQERKLQVDELNHRVKNIIATVRAIASLTFKDTEDKASAKLFEGRLVALAHAHESINNEGARTLHALVQNVVVPFCSDRLEFDGPVVTIEAGLIATLALTFQELATNALKYGALSKPDGSVCLMWEVTGEEGNHKLAIQWVETASFAVTAPTHRGFGTSLLERVLKRDHKAEVRMTYPPEGARCEIVVPV